MSPNDFISASAKKHPGSRRLTVVFVALVISVVAFLVLWASTGFRSSTYPVEERLFGFSAIVIFIAVCLFPWHRLRQNMTFRISRGGTKQSATRDDPDLRDTDDYADQKKEILPYTAASLAASRRPYIFILYLTLIAVLFDVTILWPVLGIRISDTIKNGAIWVVLIGMAFVIRGIVATLKEAIALHYPDWWSNVVEHRLSSVPTNITLAMVAFALAILWIFLLPNFLLGGSQSLAPNGWPGPDQAHVRITVQGIGYDPPAIHSLLSFDSLSDVQFSAMQRAGTIIVNDQSMTLRFDDRIQSASTETVFLPIVSGSAFHFPFSIFTASITAENFAFEGANEMPVVVVNDTSHLRIIDAFYSDTEAHIDVGFATIYPSLFVGIMVALLGFLLAIWKAQQRDHLIELAIGVFAALIAIRSFLLPSQITTPTVVDAIVLAYILLLIIVFLMRYFDLSKPAVPGPDASDQRYTPPAA